MHISRSAAINFITLPIPLFTASFLLGLMSDIFDFEIGTKLYTITLPIFFIAAIVLIPLGLITLRRIHREEIGFVNKSKKK